MKLVNGYDLITEDNGEDMYVLAPVEADDDTGWAVVLFWYLHGANPEHTGPAMAAAMLTTNTDRNKLTRLRDGLNKLLEEQERRRKYEEVPNGRLVAGE